MIVQRAREETRCCHYELLFYYAPSHRQDSTYHGFYYTSCGALTEKKKSSMGINSITHRTISRCSITDAVIIPKRKTLMHGYCCIFSGHTIMSVTEKWMNDCLTTSQHTNLGFFTLENMALPSVGPLLAHCWPTLLMAEDGRSSERTDSPRDVPTWTPYLDTKLFHDEKTYKAPACFCILLYVW